MAKDNDVGNVLANHVSGQSNKPLTRPAHALEYGTLITEINTGADDGLSKEEALSRLEEHGHNEIGAQGGVSIAKILVRQVANAMILVLMIAMAVSFGIQSWVRCSLVTKYTVLI